MALNGVGVALSCEVDGGAHERLADAAPPSAHRRARSLSCEYEVARLFGHCRYGSVSHCSRNAWQHRGVNDTQVRNASNAQGFINDGPDTAGADRVVEGVRRTTNEIVLSGDVRPTGARIDFLPPPLAKRGAGAEVAGKSNALCENTQISRF